VTKESIVALEVAEMEACADLNRAASPEVAAAVGLGVAQVGDAVLIWANRIDVLALNRLIGLGLRERPSESTLAEAMAALERTGSPRCFVQVAPVDGSERLASGLEQRGLRHYNNWMRLRLDLPGPEHLSKAPASVPEVRRIGPEHAEAFGRIVAKAFDYPPAIAPLAGQVIGRPNWWHYIAFDGETPIATAAMYLTGDAAWFGFAATDEQHRRRGAQQALVLRRIEDATKAGCRWISVETAEDTVTRDAPSFRNLRRLGFEVAYRRPNYLWTRTASSGWPPWSAFWTELVREPADGPV